MDCIACKESEYPLCEAGFIPTSDGRYKLCERKRLELVLHHFLPLSNLKGFLNNISSINLQDDIPNKLVISGYSISDTNNALKFIVSQHINKKLKQAVYYHAPSWSGRGWDFIYQDFNSPSLIAVAYPDIMSGSADYLNAVIQKLMGRIADANSVVFGIKSRWVARTDLDEQLQYLMDEECTWVEKYDP